MLVCVFAVVAAVGLVAASAFLFRRLARGKTGDETSSGHAGAMVSSLFLLVFAIAIVVPWTTVDSARQNTYTESQAAVETYWSAASLPAPAGAEVQAGLRDYVGFVLDNEWPLMASGRLSPEGSWRLDSLRTQVAALNVTDEDARGAKGAALDRLADLSAARRQRAADAKAAPPAGVMVLTILTGAVVLVFPFLAGARPRGLALVPMLAMAMMLGVGVYLAWDISRVFTGGLAVTPDAFSAALQEFQRIPESR
ncbi:hypothetical protein GCM10023194_61710 [Planotetraspora phitsanulokensis]|uniref:DUF4239 domain-containing protein n=1 Tax=Planotetraspora phitsanulokensis TaxID=575192 RepID=A0A8J3XII5_9ACTN|nr:DUF4239 domain-containing protein [Planotetraspora phitsanulokensis]GII37608.1 hypothetical protein Pph01_26110 [Planotetraspora phitsanulokensis]